MPRSEAFESGADCESGHKAPPTVLFPPPLRICLQPADTSFSRIMLFHCVYFWLKPELTAAQRAEFRRGVETLAGIKAAAAVSVGGPAPTTARPVIDSSYDVALIVQCSDVAAEAAYQVDPIHLAFVEQFKTYWTRVQIYDSQ
jgi:Stress responsive A/B Barrel Domain